MSDPKKKNVGNAWPFVHLRITPFPRKAKWLIHAFVSLPPGWFPEDISSLGWSVFFLSFFLNRLQ